MISKCSRLKEVRELLSQGHWPAASPAELREHVAGCRSCSETVLLTQSFRAARESSAGNVKLMPPGLIWWRAQLRQRQAAMERVSRPIWGAQIFAVVISLSGVLGLVGWLALKGYWRNEVSASLLTLKAGLGMLPTAMGVALLAVVVGAAVYLTVERE